MKKAGNKNLKIIAATSMAIFSLLTTFSAAFAWFTAMRHREKEVDNFTVTKTSSLIDEIYFYKYIGTSTEETDAESKKHTYYGFDPTPIGSLDVSGNVVDGTAPTISLGTYSLSDPHHLLMMVFKINKAVGAIKASTDYSFLANDSIASPTQTLADYATLTGVNKAALSGGEVYQITTDENHGGVMTQYRFDAEKNDWEMIYVTLKQQDNPLSSVIKANVFTFNELPNASNHSLYLYSNSVALPNNYNTQEMRDTNPTSTSCIALDTADFKDSESKSFVDITNGNVTGFEKEIELFSSNQVEDFNYVAIVLDYHATSIEYICYHYLGHRYLNDGLQFKCDWETII